MSKLLLKHDRSKTKTALPRPTRRISEVMGDNEFYDLHVPLAFTKARHNERIEGHKAITQSWRMKERVYIYFWYNFVMYDRIFF